SLVSTLLSLVFFLPLPSPSLIPTSFPYTTLFRSLDCIWFCHSKKVRIPGTEDMEEYKDYRFHIRQSCIGMLLGLPACLAVGVITDRKSTRLNSSHVSSSYAVFCLKKKILKKSGTR